MLSHRGRRILFELIREYLATGEAVSSSTLAARAAMELSSASIRAVFSELDNELLVHKAHASAGRIPTALGLRLFIDALLADSSLAPEVLADLERRFATREPGLDAALRHTGRVLADVTGAASVVLSAPRQSWILQDLRFISVRSDEVLAVIVTDNGAVQHRVLRTEHAISPADLDRANNQLKTLLNGHTLAEIRTILAEQLATERGRLDHELRLALHLGDRATVAAAAEPELIVEGAARLIGNPDFRDIVRARQALLALEDHERLVQLLDRTIDAPGIQVLMGADDANDDQGGLSFVIAPFGLGTIAVVGPQRMDYASVVPVVRHMGWLLKKATN